MFNMDQGKFPVFEAIIFRNSTLPGKNRYAIIIGLY